MMFYRRGPGMAEVLIGLVIGCGIIFFFMVVIVGLILLVSTVL